jgi:hypothetical protein
LLRRLPGQTLQTRGDKLLKPVSRIVVYLIAFAEILYFNCDVTRSCLVNSMEFMISVFTLALARLVLLVSFHFYDPFVSLYLDAND